MLLLRSIWHANGHGESVLISWSIFIQQPHVVGRVWFGMEKTDRPVVVHQRPRPSIRICRLSNIVGIGIFSLFLFLDGIWQSSNVTWLYVLKLTNRVDPAHEASSKRPPKSRALARHSPANRSSDLIVATWANCFHFSSLSACWAIS